jgi:hypothetical protein
MSVKIIRVLAIVCVGFKVYSMVYWAIHWIFNV